MVAAVPALAADRAGGPKPLRPLPVTTARYTGCAGDVFSLQVEPAEREGGLERTENVKGVVAWAGVVSIIVCAALVGSAVPPAAACQARPLTADEQARRQAAVRFAEQVNAAQARRHAQDGRYAPLAEVVPLDRVPIGFVPRLIADRWSYALTLKDLFDACGYTVFTDQDGVVYEAYPVAPAR
jgi:hypothetical protein